MLADDPSPASAHRPPNVLIVGGGIAALESLLALRVLAGPRVAITLLTAEATLAPPAMTVAEPFQRGGAHTYDWSQIARQQGAQLVVDELLAVVASEGTVFTRDGCLRYDVLVITTGAQRVEPFAGALTFGTRAEAAPRLSALIADIRRRTPASVAFALPSPSSWPLPLYELALLAANELREHGCATTVRIVTPEEHPLGVFGPAARDAVVPMLDALGIELVTGAQARTVEPDGLRLDGGELVPADHVVTVPEVIARPIPGLPVDRLGFLPVDLHGRVTGERAVYAAGEATSFPLRQGGLATQQADAAAAAIAAACGAGNAPMPFTPVLRGRLLTSGAPLYLQSRPSGQSLASTHALWSPPAKIAGRYLAPYLATARPPSIGAAPLTERVPVIAGRGGPVKRDAVILALELADAEARCGNTARAVQAREAAHALNRDPNPIHTESRTPWLKL
jgi:sulfide:quinone oxidoreductase